MSDLKNATDYISLILVSKLKQVTGKCTAELDVHPFEPELCVCLHHVRRHQVNNASPPTHTLIRCPRGEKKANHGDHRSSELFTAHKMSSAHFSANLPPPLPLCIVTELNEGGKAQQQHRWESASCCMEASTHAAMAATDLYTAQLMESGGIPLNTWLSLFSEKFVFSFLDANVETKK